MTSAAPGRSPRRTLRRLSAGAVAGLAAVVLAGCQSASPIQTQVPYEPADGVAVDLGVVRINDLLVVSTTEGVAGVLSGLVVNQSAERQTVSIAAGDATPVTVTVQPNQVRRLSGGNAPPAAPLAAVDAIPGGVVTLTISTPASGPTDVEVPVLPPRGYLSTVTVPPGSTPAATPTPTEPAPATPTEASTESPTATAT